MQLARTASTVYCIDLDGDVFSMQTGRPVVMVSQKGDGIEIVIGCGEPEMTGRLSTVAVQCNDRTNSGREVSNTIHVVRGLDGIDAAGKDEVKVG